MLLGLPFVWVSSELPPLLTRLLSDAGGVKVGVGVVDDARKLHSQFDVVVAGLLELRVLVAWRGDVELEQRGLEALATHYLSTPRWKSKSVTVRCSPVRRTVLSVGVGLGCSRGIVCLCGPCRCVWV